MARFFPIISRSLHYSRIITRLWKLTHNAEVDDVRGFLSFRVRCEAGVIPGCLLRYALEDQRVIRKNDARGDVVMEFVVLRERKIRGVVFIRRREGTSRA